MNRGTAALTSLLRAPPFIAAAALCLSFVIAYAADAIHHQLVQDASTTFNVRSASLFVAVTPLIMAATMLALAWLILVRLPPSRPSAAIFLIAGIFVAAEYLSFLVPFPLWLRETVIGRFRYEITNVGGHSNLYSLAAFWIVAGIAGSSRGR